MAKLNPNMWLTGLSGASQGASSLDRLQKLNKLFGSLDTAVNSKSTRGKFEGLLGVLGGIGGDASKKEANPNTKTEQKENPRQQLKIGKMGNLAMGGLKDYRKKWLDHHSGKNPIKDTEYLKNLQDIILYPNKYGFKI
tara:strand:+ start:68 stop:481 length:414 start_codon:yes stop_codon:yes gene_type:complete